MSAVVTDHLPLYVREANAIIEILDSQPGKKWEKTQKELSEELGIVPSVLSQRVKLLVDTGKVHKGASLPTRGRSHVLELVDSTPLVAPVRQHDKDDRVMTQEEEKTWGPVKFDEFDEEKIKTAVINAFSDYMNKDRELRQYKSAVATLRERVAEEHDRAEQLSHEKEELQKQMNELNAILVKLNRRIELLNNGDTTLLDPEDQAVFRVLMAS